MSDLEVVEAAHAAICEDSLADCLEWGGRCVKSVKATAPFIRAQALEDASDELDELASDASYNGSEDTMETWLNAATRLRARAATERGQG